MNKYLRVLKWMIQNRSIPKYRDGKFYRKQFVQETVEIRPERLMYYIATIRSKRHMMNNAPSGLKTAEYTKFDDGVLETHFTDIIDLGAFEEWAEESGAIDFETGEVVSDAITRTEWKLVEVEI